MAETKKSEKVKPETPAVELPDKVKRQRSPNFPIETLQTVVDWAANIHTEYKTHAVPIGTIHKKWKVKEHGSAGNQRIATMRAFGLIKLTGTGLARRAAISESGVRIIRRAPDRDKLLKEAALAPRVFSELWNKYKKDGLPPDDLILNYLVWERAEGQFTDEAAALAIANFRSTLAFANVQSGDIIKQVNTDDDEGESDNENDAERGDDDSGPGMAGSILSQRDYPQGGILSNLKMPPATNKPKQGTMQNTMAQDGLVQETCLADGATAMLQWPAVITQAAYEDLEYWLQGALRKMKRSIKAPETSAPPKEGE